MTNNAKKENQVLLLAEDNPGHATIVTRALKKCKPELEVMHVLDGQAVLDYLHNQNPYQDAASNPRPDIILLDLRMPKLDGMEVLTHIKNTNSLKSIPVVILTTSDSPKDMDMAYKNHANSFLVKPSDYEEFIEMLQVTVKYWLNINAIAESQTVNN